MTITNQAKALRFRYSTLFFLQFAVWGSYLTCFGQLLGAAGLGTDISWFYAAVGIVSLVTPSVLGHISDRYISAERMLAVCHLLASISMGSCWIYAQTHPRLEFWPFFALYLCFLAFFMPSLALTNTSTFKALRASGCQPLDMFPSIRLWGTAGFIAAMWFVNCAYYHDGAFGFTISDVNPYGRYRFQYTSMQLLTSSILGLFTAVYAYFLPVNHQTNNLPNPSESSPMQVLRSGKVRVFLLFCILIGVCLQLSNGFVTPFITQFQSSDTYRGTFVADNATLLFSLSQISELVCVLFVGKAIKRLGFRIVVLTAMVAWCLRFLFLAYGNPTSQLWMLLASMIVYGIAFNFFNIAGNLFMEQHAGTEHKGLGQGLLMMASNGVGATIGMLGAGAVINHFCSWVSTSSGRFFVGDWTTVWTIFGIYALCVGIAFALSFRGKAAQPQHC